MLNFSIALPSRERVGLLTNLLQSLVDTTHDIDNIEVLVGIDNDDVQTHEAKDKLIEKFPFTIFYSRDRRPELNDGYINWVYKNSCAYHACRGSKFAIACNDDVLFKTPKWDKIMLDKLEDYLSDKPDRIVYAKTSDNILNHFGLGYCCFPTVSREGVEALDWLMPPEFASWEADIVCWRVYAAVGRICDISEVTIEHVSYHAGKRERDHISYYVESIQGSRTYAHPKDVNYYIQLLSNKITEFTKS